MKAEFYYHYPFFGDVLLVDLDSEAIPTAYQRDGDVVTVFSEGRIVGVNLFRFSEVAKIRSSGRIFLPPDALIDIVNDRCGFSGDQKIDYVRESGFKIGKILQIEPLPDHRFRITVDLGGEEIDVLSECDRFEHDRVVVAGTGTLLADGKRVGRTEKGVLCSSRDLHAEADDPDRPLTLEEELSPGTDFFTVRSR